MPDDTGEKSALSSTEAVAEIHNSLYGELFTLAQAGEALKMSERSVRRLVTSGQVEQVRVGRSPYVRVSSLRDYVRRVLDSSGDGDAEASHGCDGGSQP